MAPSSVGNGIESGWKILDDLTTNAYQTQQQVLEAILAQNVHTEYLSRFLDPHSNKEDFKKKVPVADYENIKPYIDRIANGERSDILLAETVTALTKSSGTSSGQQKMIPYTDEELDRRTYFNSLVMSSVNKFVDGLNKGKWMQLLYIWPESKTPSGLPARSITTGLIMNGKFENNTSPMGTILCLDTKQSTYCQLLCGLVQRNEVVSVGAIFGSVLLRAIRFLEDHWKELCSNIRTGQLSDWISDSGCINALSSILNKPNPELADLIYDICDAKSWEGIIKKLWPRTKCIDGIVTGTMSQYVPMLKFYCGAIPLVSKLYTSSECSFGINLDPLSKTCDASYTLVPNMAYFEFLPIHESNEEDEVLVDLMNVKFGQCYELVITTFTGLYRYKMADILKVTGYHNNAPRFQIMRRKDAFLSIDVEKITEEEFSEAVTRAKLFVGKFRLDLVDYTSIVDLSSIPGHYVLFWELKPEGSCDLPELSPEMIEQCCYIVEESLNVLYRDARQGNAIGPLEIRVVDHGTFDALMEFSISKGSSISQYKTPRCIKRDEAIEILNSGVVGRYFSRQLPASKPLKW